MEISFRLVALVHTSSSIFSDDVPLLAVGRRFAVPWLHRAVLETIDEGRGLAFFGDADLLLPYIPAHRVKDTLLIELDREYPTAYNLFSRVPQDEHSDTADFIVDAFSAVWPSQIPTTLLDNNLLAASLAMMGVSDGTLFKLPYLFTSEKYRSSVIGQLKDSVLKRLWQDFAALDKRDQHQQSLSVQNRLLPIISDTLYRNVIGQKGTFKLKDTDVLLVKLPKGRKAELLAALLMARLKGLVFIERPHIFVGPGNPVIAVDYLRQLPEKLLTRMLGLADVLAFRLGSQDARELGSIFEIKDQEIQLTELPRNEAWLSSQGTSYVTLPKREFRVYEHSARKIRERSRTRFAQARENVEADLTLFIEKET